MHRDAVQEARLGRSAMLPWNKTDRNKTDPSKDTGAYRVRPLSFERRLTMQAFDALPPGHNMMALVEVDVTALSEAVRAQREVGRHLSLFACVVRSIAVALAEHPSLNALRSKNHIVEFEDVDVSIPVELGGFPRQIIIRKADTKGAEEIYGEVQRAKESYRAEQSAGADDRRARRLMQVLLRVPKIVRNRVLRWYADDAFAAKRLSGTTFVTSVTAFVEGSGFVIPFMAGPRAVSFALAGLARKPAVVDDAIQVREFLGMTIVFNHDIVDGAPAARFVSRLKDLIERAEVLRKAPAPT